MKLPRTNIHTLRYEDGCWLLYRHHNDGTQSVQFLIATENGYNTIPDATHRYQVLRAIGGIYV